MDFIFWHNHTSFWLSNQDFQHNMEGCLSPSQLIKILIIHCISWLVYTLFFSIQSTFIIPWNYKVCIDLLIRTSLDQIILQNLCFQPTTIILLAIHLLNCWVVIGLFDQNLLLAGACLGILRLLQTFIYHMTGLFCKTIKQLLTISFLF